jgi:hypothetical protein
VLLSKASFGKEDGETVVGPFRYRIRESYPLASRVAQLGLETNIDHVPPLTDDHWRNPDWIPEKW